MLRRQLAAATMAAAILALAGLPALAQSDALKRAATAMGADTVKTLRYGGEGTGWTFGDRKSTRLNSSHSDRSRMPSSA